MTTATNGNGSKLVNADAVTLLEASAEEAKRIKTEEKLNKQRQALEDKKRKQDETRTAILNNEPLKGTEEEDQELDYAPCKTVNQAMLIMCGERVDHNEALKGLCAVGKVILQVGTERIDFGKMTRETLQIAPDAMSFCYECGMSSEDVLAIALDAKKAWCLGFKTQAASEKATADKAKNQSKVDKQKAMLEKLKARKAK
jgi:hypothetical protein